MELTSTVPSLYYAKKAQAPAFCGNKAKVALDAARTMAQKAKTQAVLADYTPVAMYNRIKVLNQDPKAFAYGLLGRSNDILKSHGKLGQIQISDRKTREQTNANVMKYVFGNNSERYSIKKSGETLAYVDTKPGDDGDIFVRYLCNIQGRQRFRGLEETALQAAIENTINEKQVIPTITAVPAEIGSLDFNRASLYKMMGAEERKLCVQHNGKNIELFTYEMHCPKETIIEKLNKITQKDAFLFPETKGNFEKLKEQMQNSSSAIDASQNI